MNCLPYNSASWLGTWGWIAGSWGPPNSQKYVSWAGWCFQPLWKIFVSWDYYSQYMESHKIPWFQTTKQWVLWGIKSSKKHHSENAVSVAGSIWPKIWTPKLHSSTWYLPCYSCGSDEVHKTIQPLEEGSGETHMRWCSANWFISIATLTVQCVPLQPTLPFQQSFSMWFNFQPNSWIKWPINMLILMDQRQNNWHTDLTFSQTWYHNVS